MWPSDAGMRRRKTIYFHKRRDASSNLTLSFPRPLERIVGSMLTNFAGQPKCRRCSSSVAIELKTEWGSFAVRLAGSFQVDRTSRRNLQATNDKVERRGTAPSRGDGSLPKLS
jgi:hypothetical protein